MSDFPDFNVDKILNKHNSLLDQKKKKEDSLFRRDASLKILSGLLANSYNQFHSSNVNINIAIKIADNLIKELKK